MTKLWNATRRAALATVRIMLLFLGISAVHMGLERGNPIGWMAPALLCLGLYVILGDRG